VASGLVFLLRYKCVLLYKLISLALWIMKVNIAVMKAFMLCITSIFQKSSWWKLTYSDNCLPVFVHFYLNVFCTLPLSSSMMSVWKMRKIIRTLCFIAVMHTHEWSVDLWLGSDFCAFFCYNQDHFVLVLFAFVVLGLIYDRSLA